MSKIRAPQWLKRIWEKERLEAKVRTSRVAISDEQRKQIRRRIKAARQAKDEWNGAADPAPHLAPGGTFAVDSLSQIWDEAYARRRMDEELLRHWQAYNTQQAFPQYTTYVSTKLADALYPQFYYSQFGMQRKLPRDYGQTVKTQRASIEPMWNQAWYATAINSVPQGLPPAPKRKEFFFKSTPSANNDLSQYEI